MMMKTEIGGYLELEEMTGQEYYPDLYKVNLGRTALMWLIESRKCDKIYLPYFLCDSVISACEKTGVQTEFYYLNENLEPMLDIDSPLTDGSWLYLVNYYGQLTDTLIESYRESYGQIIVDHTHSFFQRPVKGVDTLYSCRKFFGLSDGAYLYTEAKLTKNKPLDRSNERMTHILGRYEVDAGTFYKKMLDNASTYHDMEIRKMSRLTENLLRGIDYDRARDRRNNNYLLLRKLLPSDNPFTRIIPDAPFAYPFYCENGPQLRKELAAKKIFVPTNWSNVISSMDADTLEYQWASNILPLPIDQRYGKEEMIYMADILKELLMNI